MGRGLFSLLVDCKSCTDSQSWFPERDRDFLELDKTVSLLLSLPLRGEVGAEGVRRLRGVWDGGGPVHCRRVLPTLSAGPDS